MGLPRRDLPQAWTRNPCRARFPKSDGSGERFFDEIFFRGTNPGPARGLRCLFHLKIIGGVFADGFNDVEPLFDQKARIVGVT